MPPTAHRTTSLEVARRAGVSQSTVSLVLSGKGRGRASADVQRRVRRAATELGYRPHSAARALRSGRARAVGLLVPDVTNPFLGSVLRGAQRVAAEHDHAVALVEPGRDPDRRLAAVDALREGGVDGLLVFTGTGPPPAGAPCVTIEIKHPGTPAVVLDIAAGADAALRHLGDLGHRRIAHLAAELPEPTFALRGARYRAAVAPRDRAEARCDFALVPARTAARALLGESPRPTAIFCDDDLLAAGARLAAADLGLEVPGDVALCGFTGTLVGEAMLPPLTTVLAPGEELGATAMGVLLDLLAGRDVPARTVLPVALTIRSSTTP